VQCRALAAAVFGSSTDTLSLIDVTPSDRFEALNNDTVDVLASSVTHTMQRHIREVRTYTPISVAVDHFENPAITDRTVLTCHWATLLAFDWNGLLLQYSVPL